MKSQVQPDKKFSLPVKSNSLLNVLMPNRFIRLIFFLCLFENFITRLVLVVYDFDALNNSIVDPIKILLVGLYSDALYFGYFLIPIILYFIILPKSLIKSAANKIFLHFIAIAIIVLFAFQGHCEWFFWQEFHSRFNFIAVDYLVYTQEVLGNINESYPMHWVYISVFASAALVYLLTKNLIVSSIDQLTEKSFTSRIIKGFTLLMIPIFIFLILGELNAKTSDNKIVDQLSKNGLYEGFSAFWKNELDYYDFYKTLDDKTLLAKMIPELKSANSRVYPDIPEKPFRQISNTGPNRNHNVIFVVVESLSASFLTAYGNKRNITPYLDKLIEKSLSFSQLYATGLRTVRGLEALTLSLPPTPGYSIVKRPHNENLFSVGKVFQSKGYETKFIYGGFGYFDNMNYFFKNNGFNVIDRTDFESDEITFSNIWGVADENLFDKTLKEADKSFANNQPFFNFVLTTSNHRPYSYPENRIDIPSKTGREGAIKYTDYAIGTFIEKARQHDWFNNTLFVIMADHCAGGRGKTEIPIENYHIPMLIYAPKILKPQTIDTLASQIDISPTIFGLLNFSYPSKFFGKDILKLKPGEERLLLGTYQNLGFFRNKTLVTLSPKKKIEFHEINISDNKTTSSSPNNIRLNEAIGYYQLASYLLKHDMYRWDHF